MKTNYKIVLHKLSKYHGETTENHKNGKIHEEEYTFHYNDYKEALDDYTEYCAKSANFLSLPLNSWTSTHTIKFIDNTENNPDKSFENFSLVVRQLTMSNL